MSELYFVSFTFLNLLLDSRETFHLRGMWGLAQNFGSEEPFSVKQGVGFGFIYLWLLLLLYSTSRRGCGCHCNVCYKWVFASLNSHKIIQYALFYYDHLDFLSRFSFPIICRLNSRSNIALVCCH